VRTGAGKCINKVVTDTSILARIAEAVVDVVLAIGTLESWRTGARMRSNEILTGSSVLARSRVAFVDLVLAVGSSVTRHRCIDGCCRYLRNFFHGGIVSEELILYGGLHLYKGPSQHHTAILSIREPKYADGSN